MDARTDSARCCDRSLAPAVAQRLPGWRRKELDVERARGLRSQGWSWAGIGEQLGVSRKTVRRRVQELTGAEVHGA
jgi:DNA-binding NarL/FixJ family response regulator